MSNRIPLFLFINYSVSISDNQRPTADSLQAVKTRHQATRTHSAHWIDRSIPPATHQCTIKGVAQDRALTSRLIIIGKMDDIESSITELQKLLAHKAPICCPAVFPSSFRVKTIYDLFQTTSGSQHKAEIAKWLELEKCAENDVVFSTVFDFKTRIIEVIPRKVRDGWMCPWIDLLQVLTLKSVLFTLNLCVAL